ncbi:cupin domain-containing protein [Paenibacillus sedimenti]|uniref:Cupin domain-containing protein n=1 Tax=Paenibacillus sedimenti TaxID=2770274 RepID=A0A926KW64_9BACL|nr:cupin domain-containing protein [Paenibacillus sedimenti]MBD0383318.1 cupin domain-containing protein [Paenibacillus sedimenti]
MSHARLSRTIENPLVQDRVTFITTGAESGGSFEYVEVELAPGGGVDLHYHLAFTEHFEAVHGVLHLELDGLFRELLPGQTVSAPPGSLHRFFNPGHEKIIFHVKIAPARRFEQMLRISYGLARDGKVRGKTGIPRNVLDLAVIFELGETYMKGIPIGLQKGIFGTLYRIAKWRGVEERLLDTYCR